MFDLKQMFNELFAEKTRILLTILALAWGTTSIASILAVGEGLRLNFRQAMAGVGKAILIVKGGQTTKPFHGQAAKQAVNLTRQDYATLKKGLREAIAAISAENQSFHKMEYNKKTYAGSLLAVDPAYGAMRNIIPQPGGRFIDALDTRNNSRVIVLGTRIVPLLFSANENPLGKNIFIDGIPFLVIGVMQNKMQMNVYIGPQDTMQNWIPASTYRLLTRVNIINDFVILPKSLLHIEILKQQIRRLIAVNHQVDPNDSGIIKLQDSASAQQRIDDFFLGMEVFLGIVGALTLIVAGVGIANVMLVSVKKATRDIGIRMAVGARSAQILLHYLIEALLAALLGGFIGFAAAWGIVRLVNFLPVASGIAQSIGTLKPVLSVSVIATVIIMLGLVAFFAAFFPARKASLINPAEALRHE